MKNDYQPITIFFLKKKKTYHNLLFCPRWGLAVNKKKKKKSSKFFKIKKLETLMKVHMLIITSKLQIS